MYFPVDPLKVWDCPTITVNDQVVVGQDCKSRFEDYRMDNTVLGVSLRYRQASGGVALSDNLNGDSPQATVDGSLNIDFKSGVRPLFFLPARCD